jgi:tripartite-type tricarboxylate transporter receptor subunit TctC
MKKIILFVFAFIISTAYAFDGKEHPIKFVVPFAPGGGTDSAIRIYEKYINELGYLTVIEYKPGADGLLGKKHFISKNDMSGYTILVNGSVAMAHEDSFVKEKGWDISDFTLVSDIINVPNTLVASKKSGITSISALQEKVKSRDQLFFAYGALTGKFASMILMDHMDYDPKKTTFVPYKGAAPALNDVLGGHVDLVMVPVSMSIGLYETDKANVLFVGGQKRFKKMPNIPTATELNLPLPYIGAWGVVLPKNIDRVVQDFYVQLFKKIASDPRLIEDLNSIDAFISADKVGPKHMMDNYNKHMKLFRKFSDVN